MFLKQFKNKKSLQSEQGFSLIEVLVAILIITVFVTVTMQALAIAAIFKVRAKQYGAATTWIQDNLDAVKLKSAQLRYTKLTTAATTSTTQLSVISVDGFVVGDALKVGDDSTSNIISSINSSTNTITLTSALGTTQVVSAVVLPTTKSTTLEVAATAGNLSALIVNSATDFRTTDRVKVGTDTSIKSISTIVITTTTIPPIHTITLSSALSQPQPKDATVVGIPNLCSATASNSGFAYSLQQRLPTAVSGTSAITLLIKDSNGTNQPVVFDVIENNKQVGGNTFRLLQNSNITNTAPNVLELIYAVVPSDTIKPIAILQTQVLPDAAFSCP